MTERSENNLTEIVDVIARQIYERAAQDNAHVRDTPWNAVPLVARNSLKSDLLPVIMGVLNLVDAEPFKAKRGDEVEAWLKKARDQFSDSRTEYEAVDDLLDDYRAHADYGTPLSEVVEEPPSDYAERISPPGSGSEGLLADVRMEGKVMRLYDYRSDQYPAELFPDHYENQDHQHDIYTATVWTLHLNVHPEAREAVLERVSQLPEATGEYTYGDSWREWGEETADDDDRHMCIYFTAEPKQAYRVGAHIADHVHVVATRARSDLLVLLEATHPNLNFAISTSGDYSQQLQED